MTPAQRYWWKIALELKLRKSSGDAFQEFFSTVMEKVYGSDFIRVRPFGALGDKGCDGYLQSTGCVYQCYGALTGNRGKVASLIAKMGKDFEKALAGVSAIMRAWYMVHNLVDGLPIEAINKLKQLETMNSRYEFGFLGIEGLERLIFGLDPNKITDLLGVAATSEDTRNLQPIELRDLVVSIVDTMDELPFQVTDVRPVPPGKLEFNELPSHWQSLIANGYQNARMVEEYLARHHDPLLGEKLAQLFRVKYQYLKTQKLTPSEIMTSLYEFVTGGGYLAPKRQVAGQALLSVLFESCDIFEDCPREIAT